MLKRKVKKKQHIYMCDPTACNWCWVRIETGSLRCAGQKLWLSGVSITLSEGRCDVSQKYLLLWTVAGVTNISWMNEWKLYICGAQKLPHKTLGIHSTSFTCQFLRMGLWDSLNYLLLLNQLAELDDVGVIGMEIGWFLGACKKIYKNPRKHQCDCFLGGRVTHG